MGDALNALRPQRLRTKAVLSHKVHFSALPAIMSHNSNKIRFICLVLNGVILKNKSFS
ncbi:hypothetical protein [Bathymodiolus platifrons methanotrophic gill symbiont]|uniref:hypothetical protein n=1 Tax=Bathymodiolus platifrons methanotrophic gill symbiont TaxID=113268 RepID=UPI001E4536A5|nr:hypothetical protein [Bathymodiolus platifrons methanotrophic gill symbiont]